MMILGLIKRCYQPFMVMRAASLGQSQLLLMKRPMDEKGWIRQRENAKECVVRKAAPPRG